MLTIDVLADALVRRDSLALRALAQEFLRSDIRLSDIPRPQTTDPRTLAAAAALVELFAGRAGRPAPAWTATVGPLPEAFYVLEAASRMSRLRRLCDSESPEPLRKRRLYAPPNFLEFA